MHETVDFCKRKEKILLLFESEHWIIFGNYYGKTYIKKEKNKNCL